MALSREYRMMTVSVSGSSIPGLQLSRPANTGFGKAARRVASRYLSPMRTVPHFLQKYGIQANMKEPSLCTPAL